MTAAKRMLDALNRVTKWRTVFAGWQLGTRPIGDPESDAVRDLRELLIVLRVEVTALSRVLDEAGVIDRERFMEVIAEEADLLSQAYAERFPGFRATDSGLVMDIRAQETMRGWRQ